MVESFRKYMREDRLEEIKEEARRKHEKASEYLHMYREEIRGARALDDEVAMMEETDLGLNSSTQLGKNNDISAARTTFTWSDMTYTVPIKGGSKVLLDKVEGWIKPGQMTALYVLPLLCCVLILTFL